MTSVEWEVRDTGVASAEVNMALDAAFLSQLGSRNTPLIHFYEWEGDSATYGLLVKPEQYLDIKAAEERGISLAARPTGGGIVFHIWDLAFSVLVPATCPLFSVSTQENYALINNAVLLAVQEFMQSASDLKDCAKITFTLSEGCEAPPAASGSSGIGITTIPSSPAATSEVSRSSQSVKFISAQSLKLTPHDGPALEKGCTRFCMAGPTKYDVVVGGRKVAGAAQRKTKAGLLHQGTIALTRPDSDLLSALLPKESHILEAMQQSTFPLLPAEANKHEQSVAKETLKHLLTKHLKQGRSHE